MTVSINHIWLFLTSCNWLAVMWFVCILVLMVYSILDGRFSKYIPTWFQNITAYGKIRAATPGKTAETNIFVKLLFMQVPKSYFTQFYAVATVYCIGLIFILIYSYLNLRTSPIVIIFLDLCGSVHRNAYDMDPVTIINVMFMLLIQVSRRLYECIYISTFSPKSKMSLLMYILGITFYINTITSVMVEAPGFTKSGFDHISFKQEYKWRWYQLIGIVIYFWAAWHQHRAICILSSLRTDGKGKKTFDYKIPTGDWFNYVSSPHYLAEMLIYFSINLVLKFNNSLLLLSWIFTLLNQLICAQQNHHYYLTNFKDYPKNRKIIIPNIY